MIFLSGPPETPPPFLKPTLFEFWREVVGGVVGVGGGVKEIPFFLSKNKILLVVFFLSRAEKVFSGPDSMEFVWNGVG